MLLKTLFLVTLPITTCSAHVIFPHGHSNATIANSHIRSCSILSDRIFERDTPSPATSTELSTETETYLQTFTIVTTQLQTASITDRITITSGSSEKKTLTMANSDVPSETATENQASTITVDQTYSTVTEKETVVQMSTTTETTTTTEKPAATAIDVVEPEPKPAPALCTYPDSESPYHKWNTPETQINLVGLHPKIAECFRIFIDKGLNDRSFCALSTQTLHNFFQTKVFDCMCNRGDDPDHVWTKTENDEMIRCFSAWMENLCGFHQITNTGLEIDQICSKDW